MPRQPDLVVLSHLRWAWVWQRPQHLVSRLARARAAGGARTWFVEEPVVGDVTAPELRRREVGAVTRVWLVVPPVHDPYGARRFDGPAAGDYAALLARMLADEGRPGSPDVWLYTPTALDTARCLDPGLVVYDVMDDLSSFLDAPPELVLRQRRLIAEADVVFTGGRSLHQTVTAHRRDGVHLFPSGVETSHYAASRALRAPRPARVAGYVGVLDERVDLGLVRDLAAALPDWTVRLVGPTAKIAASSVPHAPNIDRVGQVPYERLPEVMAGLDVALMPFALNEATRSISPTKTLEYLAAGLPVVSTRVPDVVADYGAVVALADDGAGFAAACRDLLGRPPEERDRALRPIRARLEWDSIASSMAALIARARAATGAGDGRASA